MWFAESDPNVSLGHSRWSVPSTPVNRAHWLHNWAIHLWLVERILLHESQMGIRWLVLNLRFMEEAATSKMSIAFLSRCLWATLGAWRHLVQVDFLDHGHLSHVLLVLLWHGDFGDVGLDRWSSCSEGCCPLVLNCFGRVGCLVLVWIGHLSDLLEISANRCQTLEIEVLYRFF